MWVPSWGKRELGPLRAEQSPISHAFLVSSAGLAADSTESTYMAIENSPSPFLALNLEAELYKSASIIRRLLPYPLTPSCFHTDCRKEQTGGWARPCTGQSVQLCQTGVRTGARNLTNPFKNATTVYLQS